MASVTSPDGNYTAAVTLNQDLNGLYVVAISVTAVNASQDIINVRVNGVGVWQGLATEATGG